MWSPTQYERFKDERARPFYDLLALVERREAMRVVDLGCGTGSLTKALHEHLDAKETLGLDSSAEMLAAATPHAGRGLTFAQGDLAAFRAEPAVDLVFSNAALQWADDHPALLAHLAASVGASGQLAVQVPANHDHPSQTVAAEVAREPPFADALRGFFRVSPVLPPEAYATLLERLGFARQVVRLEVYGHHLASRAEVIEWVKGTVLLDYQKRLSEETYAAFLARYRERLLAQLPDDRPFFFPFKRIFFWGAR